MSDFKDNAIGTGVGLASYVGIKKVAKKVTKQYSKKIIKKLTDYSENEKNILREATKDAFEMSGLKKAKVHLHSVNSKEEVDRISELLTRKLKIVTKKNKFFNFFQKIEDKLKSIEKRLFKKSKSANPKILKSPVDILKNIDLNDLKKTNIKKILPEPPKRLDKEIKKFVNVVAKGKNAFYHPLTKDIVINPTKFPSASFHEMGHALNATGSKLMKSLAAGRHVAAIIGIPLVLAVGLLKPKKNEGEKPKGIFDKTTTFIKNNAGKLTFAALIPTLAEEGIASIRGGQLAKKVLNPELLKKVNKRNFIAWTTYLAAALILSGITALSVKIRDVAASKSKQISAKNN